MTFLTIGQLWLGFCSFDEEKIQKKQEVLSDEEKRQGDLPKTTTDAGGEDPVFVCYTVSDIVKVVLRCVLLVCR